MKEEISETSRLNGFIADLYDRERLKVELDEFYRYTASICTQHSTELLLDSLEVYHYERHEEISSRVDTTDKSSHNPDLGYDQIDYREPQSESMKRTTSCDLSREKEEDYEPIPSLPIANVLSHSSPSKSGRHTTLPSYDKPNQAHLSTCTSKHKSNINLSIIELKAKKRWLERQRKLGELNSTLSTE